MDDFRISDMKKRKEAGLTKPGSKTSFTPPSDDSLTDSGPERNFSTSGSFDGFFQPDEVNLRQYWETIMQYRKVVIIITAVVFLAVLVPSFFKPEKYIATVEILRKAEPSDISFSSRKETYYIETLVKIVLSRPVLERAAKLLPDELKRFGEIGYNVPERDFNLILDDKFPGDVSAGLDADADDIMHITAVSYKSGFLAAGIVNTVAYALIDRLAEMSRKEALQGSEIIAGLQEVKQKEIQEIENEILVLKRQQGEKEKSFTAFAADEKRLLDLVSEYEMMFQENKLLKEELVEQIKAIKNELGVGDISTNDIQWVDLSNVMEKELQILKVKRTELLTRYTPENPLIKRIDAQLKAMGSMYVSKTEKNDTKKRVPVDSLRSRTVTNLIVLESKLRGAEKKLKSIEKIRDDLNRKLIVLPVEMLRIERLKRQKEVLEKLSDDLRRDYQEKKIAITGGSAEIEIIEEALPVSKPFSSSKRKAGTMGIMLGLFLGVAAAFILEHWNNTITNTRELKQKLNIEPLGLIPLWADEDKYIRAKGHDDVNADVYGVLRNNIRYSNANEPEKCLLVASSIQSEGKSLTTMNLAISFALEGNRTLLISMDLRHKRDYHELRDDEKINSNEKGTGDFLAEDIGYSNIIYGSNIENLYVMPTGEKRKNPAKLLNSPKIKKLFTDMEKEFDVVIIDAPAVLPVVDTTIISPHVRGVLVVVQEGKTPIGACQQSIGRLLHVNSPVIGAVLNKAKNTRDDFFYGFGYNVYGKKSKAGMYQ